MGDSFTYGNGIPEDRRFSNLIGGALQDQPIEVLNFGFPGNNWPEHVRTLERRVLRLRPDFILLQWGTNDIELDGDVRGRPQIPPLIADREWHEALYRQSALYTMLNAQWLRYQLRRDMGDTYPSYLRQHYLDPKSEAAQQADRLMRRFVALARSRGGDVGLVLFPDAAVALGDDYPSRFMHEQVLGICAATQVRCVDLRPALATVPDRSTLWASPLDSQPSVLANRMAAAILQAYRPLWVGAAAAVHAAPTRAVE
jgi:lysophospholipase L1-like esterase